MHVPLHLGEGLVLLEGEHRLEQRVEVRGEEIGVEPVLNGFVVGHLLLGHQKLDDCALSLLVQPHLVGVPTTPAVVNHPAGIDVGIVLVNCAELVKDGVGLGHLQRRDLAHDVPEALEVLTHLPATASNEALVGVPGAVERAAGDGELLQDGDVAPRHAPVTDEEGRGQQGADTRAHEVGPAIGDIGRRHRVILGVKAEVVVDERVPVR